jgi:hypothetical protein
MDQFISNTTHSHDSPNQSRGQFFWISVAAIVCAVLFAKWAWIVIAPKDVALPTTAAWKQTSNADHLFGDDQTTGTTSSGSFGNVQLVGVFAHPTAGFAVLSVEGKQVGVGLGDLVMPGARLVETKADYVLIERGGIKSRIDLPAGKPTSGVVNENIPTSQSASLPESVAQTSQLSSEQRTAMQQELEHFRRKP